VQKSEGLQINPVSNVFGFDSFSKPLNFQQGKIVEANKRGLCTCTQQCQLVLKGRALFQSRTRVLYAMSGKLIYVLATPIIMSVPAVISVAIPVSWITCAPWVGAMLLLRTTRRLSLGSITLGISPVLMAKSRSSCRG
jgi:hypothetical protein